MKYILFLFFICGCNPLKTQLSQLIGGKITNSVSFYDGKKQSFVEDVVLGDNAIYFRDSLIIQGARESNIINDGLGGRSISTYFYQYTFVDLKTRSFYDYSSFSDTAKLLRKYWQPDSLQGVVWNFYYNPYFEVVDNNYPLSDTTINKKKYKRFTWQQIYPDKKDTLVRIVYADCSKKTMFQYFKNFSEKIGCPVIRIDQMGLIPRKYLMKYEIKFDADTLTPYQHKVFDAWEKYAKEHPVEQ